MALFSGEKNKTNEISSFVSGSVYERHTQANSDMNELISFSG